MVYKPRIFFWVLLSKKSIMLNAIASIPCFRTSFGNS